MSWITARKQRLKGAWHGSLSKKTSREHTIAAVEDRMAHLVDRQAPPLISQLTEGLDKVRPSVSLTMIVKNEEKNLPACLDSVADLVDEMIVVDTGSSDATVKIARSRGSKGAFISRGLTTSRPHAMRRCVTPRAIGFCGWMPTTGWTRLIVLGCAIF